MDDGARGPQHFDRLDGRRLIAETAGIFTHEYYTQFIPDVEKVLAETKNRKNYKSPIKHLEMQYGLLQLLKEFEQASSEGIHHARKIGDEEIALQSKRNKYIAKAYKVIADGIAWRTMGYARFPMRILSQGVYAGHTWSKDIGQTAELRRAVTAASNGAFVLVNDTTNCLRVGDLVTIHAGKQEEIHIAEIKRKDLKTAFTVVQKINKKKALSVQEERLIQAQLALDKREMPLLSQNIPVVSVVPVMIDVLPGACGVMKKAIKAGVAGSMVTPYTHIQALDLATLWGMKDAEFLKTRLEETAGPKEMKPIMRYSSYDRLALTAAGLLDRSAPPYTIYPWPQRIITKLITGEMMLSVTIYLEPLEEAFRSHEWELSIDKKAVDAYDPPDKPDFTKDFTGRILFPYDQQDTYNDFLLLKNPKTGFTMPAGDLVMQMATEFTTVRYAVSVASALEEIVTPERPNASPKYPDLQDRRRWN